MARRNDDGEPRGNGLLIVSAVIVLVVVLLGIFVAVTGDGGGDGSKGEAARPAGTKAASSAAGGNSGGGGASPGASAAEGCKPTDTDQTVPATAPEDVTWSLAKTVALPRSKSAGPMLVNGLTATCYAHTPRGAVMAALNSTYRVAVAAPDKGPMRKLVLPGPGRDALEAKLNEVDIQPGEVAQVAGFRVVSYTPQTAVITMVNGSQTAHSLKASDITVQWSEGDWKVVARPDGALSTPADNVPDLVGYIQFGGL